MTELTESWITAAASVGRGTLKQSPRLLEGFGNCEGGLPLCFLIFYKTNCHRHAAW